MKNTTMKAAGKRELSRAEQPAEFRRYLESAFARYTGDEADPISRAFFNEFTDLLCLAFEREGFAGARHVLAEVELSLKAKKGEVRK
jgi:hypothetical protein